MTKAIRISFIAASISSLLVIAAIYLGSGALSRFDTPLAAYAAATVFAAFAMAYRYTMWVQRPPTWRYFKSSWKLFLRPKSLVLNIVKLARLFWDNIVAQKFIGKRSHARWMAHMCLAWGCIGAFFITIPLSWGWVQFGSDRGYYVVEVMGHRQFAFPPHSVLGFMIFNGLNICAVLVLLGVGIAMHRRVFNRGAQSVQNLATDMIPLFLLFAVAVTGLMLTASSRLMGGQNFHVPFAAARVHRRGPAALHPVRQAVPHLPTAGATRRRLLQGRGERGPQAVCLRSGLAVQPQMHHDDLAEVLPEVGFDFGEHQNLSPLELAQAHSPSTRQPTLARAVRRITMAKLPAPIETLAEDFGPHLNERRPADGSAGASRISWSKTHCCFCGQQCGIKLKVKDNEVVGFEPWDDFPFNEGKLCPKGVKRYLQNDHPDRLLAPAQARPRARGSRRFSWDEALDRTVSRDPAHPGAVRQGRRSRCCRASR